MTTLRPYQKHTALTRRRLKLTTLQALCSMRMRGLEPPPGCPDTDLNRARLPIPPHPRADEQAKIAHLERRAGGMGRPVFVCCNAGSPGRSGSERFASLDPDRFRAAIVQGTRTPPSHGGNPGSNPGSGTGLAPCLRGLCGSWGRSCQDSCQWCCRRAHGAADSCHARDLSLWRRFGEQATGPESRMALGILAVRQFWKTGRIRTIRGRFGGVLAGLPLPAFTRATRCGGTRSRAASPPIRCGRSAPNRLEPLDRRPRPRRARLRRGARRDVPCSRRG